MQRSVGQEVCLMLRPFVGGSSFVLKWSICFCLLEDVSQKVRLQIRSASSLRFLCFRKL